MLQCVHSNLVNVFFTNTQFPLFSIVERKEFHLKVINDYPRQSERTIQWLFLKKSGRFVGVDLRLLPNSYPVPLNSFFHDSVKSKSGASCSGYEIGIYTVHVFFFISITLISIPRLRIESKTMKLLFKNPQNLKKQMLIDISFDIFLIFRFSAQLPD